MENTNSSKYCLNCQTELHGKYCHVCGQNSSSTKLSIKEFILEYMNIAFIWDSHFLKTIWQILKKPGHVTNEYLAGKRVSYTHPLKLNMFLLFVFITMVILFQKNLDTSIQTVTRNEVTYPVFQMQLLLENDKYSSLLEASQLDTVQLSAPLLLADEYPEVFTTFDLPSIDARDSIMVWTTALPHLLIEDNVIAITDDGYYSFTHDHKTGVMGTELIENIWHKMVSLTTKYFPIIILLTVPFLAFVLRLTQKRGKHSNFKHFIFSLHYTAFLEMLIIFLYIAYLTVNPPGWFMQWSLISGSLLYMTIAIKKVYGTKLWIGAAASAIFTNLGYTLTLSIVFLLTVIISFIIVVVQL